MEPSSIVSIITFVAVIVVGFILKKRIDHQSEMMKNYKEYIEVMDWKEVKERYEWKIDEMKREYESNPKSKKDQEQLAEVMKELYLFAAITLSSNRSRSPQLVERYFNKAKPLFKDFTVSKCDYKNDSYKFEFIRFDDVNNARGDNENSTKVKS
jgi:hypothetical protein